MTWTTDIAYIGQLCENVNFIITSLSIVTKGIHMYVDSY